MSARAAPTGPGAVIAGNVYDKYGTTHPIARRLQAGFERAMDELLERVPGPVTSVLEVGCGEGHVTARLARRFPGARVRGTDLSAEIVAEARRLHPGLDFAVGAAEEAGADGARYDLVVACEVFEHLDDPPAALAAVARAARGHVFLSVPREPLWRALNLARGRYWGALGNTPGHVQHWSAAGFLGFVATRLEVVATRAPLPWTQALCRSRA